MNEFLRAADLLPIQSYIQQFAELISRGGSHEDVEWFQSVRALAEKLRVDIATLFELETENEEKLTVGSRTRLEYLLVTIADIDRTYNIHPEAIAVTFEGELVSPSSDNNTRAINGDVEKRPEHERGKYDRILFTQEVVGGIDKNFSAHEHMRVLGGNLPHPYHAITVPSLNIVVLASNTYGCSTYVVPCADWNTFVRESAGAKNGQTKALLQALLSRAQKFKETKQPDTWQIRLRREIAYVNYAQRSRPELLTLANWEWGNVVTEIRAFKRRFYYPPTSRVADRHEGDGRQKLMGNDGETESSMIMFEQKLYALVEHVRSTVRGLKQIGAEIPTELAAKMVDLQTLGYTMRAD